ncbi:MAG: Ig-like domain-containing protein, partial [Gallionellaceae bacterium]|nr:Ig-like domain-containing protein [Gallionellaceae bacterium]
MNILANRRADSLRTFFSIAIAATFVAWGAPGLAATAILTPTADAYVQAGNKASTNYGTAIELRAGTSTTAASNYDSYLKFDTSSVSNISNAKLRIYAKLSATGTVSTTAYAVATTTWGETTITWNNKPMPGANLGSVTVNSTTYAYKEIDVTSYVQSEYAANRKVVSFAYHNSANSSPYITANSKESTNVNKPQLLITYNTPPTVSVTAPAANSVFTSPASITLTASAADSDGVSKVDFYADNVLMGTSTATPYSYVWTNATAGAHQITAKATDNLGATTTSTAVAITVNTPPTVSLTAPTTNTIYTAPAAITLSANATDSDGISKVEFYNGTTLLSTATVAPYSYSWSNVTAGDYVLSAQATDNLGATTTSSAVNVTVNASMVTINYTYDELGRLTGMADDSGIAAQYTYDALGNIVSIQRFAGSATTIIDFTPDTGAAGSQVTITGAGFSAMPSLNTVNFNTLSAAVVSATTTRLVVNAPAGVSTGPITVTSPSGSATSSTNFVVNALAPTIASFSPTIGPTSTTVTISGTNFQTDLLNNKASINGVALKLTAVTSTSITAVVPSSIGSGKIKVTTPYGSALSVADYYYTPSPYTAANVEVTTRMDNPGAKTITIATPGKVAMVLFEGVANQRVGLYLSDVTIPTATVTIYAPNGSVYASTSAGTGGGSIGVTTLPSTGTYAILVAPASSGTGSVTLHLGGEADLAISNVTTGTLVLNANGSYTFPVTYTVTNTGAFPVPASWYDLAYLSADGVLDNTDQTLAGLTTRSTELASGGSYTATLNY